MPSETLRVVFGFSVRGLWRLRLLRRLLRFRSSWRLFLDNNPVEQRRLLRAVDRRVVSIERFRLFLGAVFPNLFRFLRGRRRNPPDGPIADEKTAAAREQRTRNSCADV